MDTLCTVTSLLVLGTFSSAQLESSVERPCPGESVTFTCTIPSPGHQWNIQSLGISRSLLRRDQGRVITDHPPFQFNVTEVIPSTSITSTATVNATADLNGTVVVCRDGVGTLSDQRTTINLRGPPSIPILSCVNFSGGVGEAVNVTMNWTLSDGDSADSYLINITTNVPQTPYGGHLNITTGSATQHEMTGFVKGYEYNITVRGVNCGSLEGTESEPLVITPQVPAVPSSCNITVSYNQSSGKLMFINSTWDTVPNPKKPCQDISGNITKYQIKRITDSVNITRCTAGRCSHNFEPLSNPPSYYDSVSVAAENVVGVGAARTCTSQTISTTNNLLTGEVIGVSSPSDTRLNCRYLFQFTGSAHCTIRYGTDPTYMNLPYSVKANGSGTAGDSVSVVLRERLNSSTVYYYTVSAVSGDITIVVQGTFTTPLYSCNITELWNLPAANATFLSDVSLLDDATQYPSCDTGSVGSAVLVNTTINTATVAYYSGTTAGSTACFVCNDGYELSTITERFCQGNGLWSGHSIICVCRLPPQTIALIVMGGFAMVIALFSATVTIIDGVIAIWTSWKAKQTQTVQQRCRITKYEIGRDKTNICWHALLMTTTVFLVIGLALWITVGVLVSNPPNGNACDPSWRSTRDGLIGSAFAVSSFAAFFAAAAILVHVHYHKKRIKKKTFLVVLLVIALIFFVIGVGLWIASAVLVYIHYQEDETDVDENSHHQTDGNSSGQTLELQDSRKEKEKEVSPGLMYAEVGPQIRPAAVIPPASDSSVPYTSLIHVQSRAEDPTGTPSSNVDTTSLPHSPLDTESSLPPPIPPNQFSDDDTLQYPTLVENSEDSPPPPPIPPQQFSADDILLSPKLLESGEPQQCERDAPPPRPPKTHQEDAAPPPRPPKTNQEDAAPPPRPPKTNQEDAALPPRPPKTNQEDAALPPRPPKTNQEDAALPPRPPKTSQEDAPPPRPPKTNQEDAAPATSP